MKRIIIYVFILSNLSVILGLEQQRNKTTFDLENERRENFTLDIRQYVPEEEENGFAKRVLSPRIGGHLPGFSTGRKPKQMLKTPGLQAYASKDPPLRNRRRNLGPGRRKPPPRPFPHEPGKNFKNFNWIQEKNRAERTAKLAFNFNKNNYKGKSIENEDQRRHHRDWRTARFNNNGKHSAKICNPCNDVPWVPLFKVPDSYRQQRTHKQELPNKLHHDFSFDFKALATEAENLLLPPTPLSPPLEPIYDGTISSSFGLPIGNIPTGHGLLAPLNHMTPNHYVDFSNSLQLLPTQTIVESSIIPQLSPVPVVPIHDSGQFFKVDTTTSDLVPPAKPVDVSNVVLTISENSHGKLNPDSIKLHAVASQEVPKTSAPAVGSYTNEELYPPLNKPLPDFGQVEIIKSIPLIEFTSTVTYPQPSLQVPSVLPPLKFHLQSIPLHPSAPPPERNIKKDVSSMEKVTDFNFLVPPPVRKQESDTSFNTSKNGVLPFLNPPKKSNVQYHEQVKASTVPRPLTSPSLSWLFSDQTPTTTTSRTTVHALHQFASDSQQIASIVNNELRPVSPQIDIDSESTTDSSKSKKIQIIIPYTTKNKKDHDNNALESVSRQVFQKMQPPVSVSTNDNSSHDSANSALTSSSSRVRQSLSADGKVTDENRNNMDFKANFDDHLTEMQHIIATNIRELLRQEIQKSQNDQNYSLQNNIDNWTALEYSNHKTIEEKAPKEIINQALAVTSIPGTSISHLLLPSKKIPKEYFATTSLPIFDEPNTQPFNATKTTVDSRPFTTKPYATTNFYQPTSTLWQSTPVNHEINYTEVERGRVNHWGRLNENLVLPESARTRKLIESTTPGLFNTFLSSSAGNEKVEIVTPVSSSSRKWNYTTLGYRRTTREVRVTEKPEILRVNSVFPLKNSTRLEKVVNFNSGQRASSALVNLSTFGRNRSASSATVSPSISTTSDRSPSFFSNQMLPSNFSSEQLLKLSKTNRTELFSINDIFPFRNEQLPWESNLNASRINFRNGRLRKSLIKLMKLKAKAKASVDSS